jgi:hypothetical protein
MFDEFLAMPVFAGAISSYEVIPMGGMAASRGGGDLNFSDVW